MAGTFYPGDTAVLAADVTARLTAVPPRVPKHPRAPKALIAPHAGYRYSGDLAAIAYHTLADRAGQVRRVVLLGPCHRVAVRGLALPGCDRFETPLGTIALDSEAIATLRDLPQVTESAAAHAQEHALEVHLPFLQTVLGDFRLVPLVVGETSPAEVAAVLDRLWGADETLIIVSSDLSHYLPYATARRTDRQTVDSMLALDPAIDPHHACGAGPVNGLLQIARQRGLEPELLGLCNSGDTAGDRDRVVGYAAIAFHEPVDATPSVMPTRTSAPRGPILLALTRATIGRQLGLPLVAREDAAFLREPGATFVTLQKAGELRGCIGSLTAHRPLGDDVKHNARAAAFLDPRFRPLGLREFDDVIVEVSLLSPATELHFTDEPDLLRQLRPGEDGLILEGDGQRGTFLPQVWDDLPEPADFLRHLKRKAGLPADFWSDAMRVWRYTVEKWSER